MDDRRNASVWGAGRKSLVELFGEPSELLVDAEVAKHKLVFVLDHSRSLVAEVEDGADDVDGRETRVLLDEFVHHANDGMDGAEGASATYSSRAMDDDGRAGIDLTNKLNQSKES